MDIQWRAPLLCCWLALASLGSLTARAGDLLVEVTNITPEQGSILLRVIDKSGYDSDEDEIPTIASTTMPASNHTLEFRLPDIPPGEYAIQVFQDLNNNGELDFSMLSGPEEPIGFSNNVTFGFLPPAWDKLKINVTDSEQRLAIALEN